jgi:hypothetical protein
MIKHRDKRGRLMEIEAKVVFGAEQAVRQLLGENTAYAERNHLTMRHFNGRLVRKSLAFSKKSGCWQSQLHGKTSTTTLCASTSP